MSGRRVAPQPSRGSRGKGRGARRAESSLLASLGVSAPRSRHAVSLATLSAVLLVSTALVAGETPQRQLAAENSPAQSAEGQSGNSRTPGVVLSRPADGGTGQRAARTGGTQETTSGAQEGSPAQTVSDSSGSTADGDEQGQVLPQSSGQGSNASGPDAPGSTDGGQPANPDPSSTDSPEPAPGETDGGTPPAGQPGDGGTEPSAPGVPVQPKPPVQPNPSTPAPTVPKPTVPPAPKPPAPVVPAPKPPQDAGCIVNILGIKICIPLLGG